MNSRKRKARIANLIGKIFIMLLFLVMIINVAVPDREESEMENRTLESRPNFNMATILTGDFMEQWENYLSDQFVGRDIWRSVKVSIDRLGGSRMENGIYIGRNGQLMEDIEVPGEGQMDENVSAIRNFADTYDDAGAGCRMHFKRQSAGICGSGRSTAAFQYGRTRAGRFSQLDRYGLRTE